MDKYDEVDVEDDSEEEEEDDSNDDLLKISRKDVFDVGSNTKITPNVIVFQRVNQSLSTSFPGRGASSDCAEKSCHYYRSC